MHNQASILENETYRPLKIRLEEYGKAVSWTEFAKSGMAAHTWKGKGKHLPIKDQVKIIVKEEHWKITRLK